jgi:hypothetical protein
MLDESLETLEASVAQYSDRGEVSLVAPAAVILRKLCHETRSQAPLLVLLEQQGESPPAFLDASPGEMLGFAIAIRLVWPNAQSASIISPLRGGQTTALAWRDWWSANALCLPADPSTGWQAGRLSVSRAQLATQWANRYGGAHVDAQGPEKWLIDLINLQRPGYWTHWLDENGNPVTELAWFDQPRDPQKDWKPIKVEHRALGHLVMVRMAAEVLSGYGRSVPAALTIPGAV